VNSQIEENIPAPEFGVHGIVSTDADAIFYQYTRFLRHRTRKFLLPHPLHVRPKLTGTKQLQLGKLTGKMDKSFNYV
jgi:hypothetical protein